jgi:hypothetical protein
MQYHFLLTHRRNTEEDVVIVHTIFDVMLETL